MARATSDIALLQKRNKAILRKFNELYEGQRIRYDEVIFLLKWEVFFIGERTLIRTLTKLGADLPYGKNISVPSPDIYTSPVDARNQKLIQRFNKLYNDQHKRYDDVIRTLSGEFFLPEKTIECYINKFIN